MVSKDEVSTFCERNVHTRDRTPDSSDRISIVEDEKVDVWVYLQVSGGFLRSTLRELVGTTLMFWPQLDRIYLRQRR